MKVVFVTCVRDEKLYRSCVLENENAEGEKVAFDNQSENLPIPVRYNSFLDAYDYTSPAWFVFCHEDFKLLENSTALLAHADPTKLYGPIGSKRIGLFGFGVQSVCGQIRQSCKNRDEDCRTVGKKVKSGTRVDTFDCCCLIVHSTVVERCRLRFDENLPWDLYVEDFCAQAKTAAKIDSCILPMNCVHYARSGPQEFQRLRALLPYLDEKYPDRCFSGVIAYFGRKPFLMRFQNVLLGR